MTAERISQSPEQTFREVHLGAERKAQHGRRVKRLLAASIQLLGLATVFVTTAPFLGGEEAAEIAEGTRALYRGTYVEARAIASKLLERHPESALARILLARVEVAQGQYEPAYEDLRKALELDPTNVDALYYLERICTILSQVEFRRLMETAPDSFRAHQLLADLYLQQHHNDEAEREYQAALRLSPDSVEILDALGELKRSEYKFGSALDYYARAGKAAPRDYTSAYGSGACYLLMERPDRAIQYLRRALTIDPGSAAAHLALGDALLRVGKADAAVAELKEVLRSGPPSRQAYTLLARACQKLGRTAEAEQALQRERQLAQDEIKARELKLEPAANSLSEPRP